MLPGGAASQVSAQRSGSFSMPTLSATVRRPAAPRPPFQSCWTIAETRESPGPCGSNTSSSSPVTTGIMAIAALRLSRPCMFESQGWTRCLALDIARARTLHLFPSRHAHNLQRSPPRRGTCCYCSPHPAAAGRQNESVLSVGRSSDLRFCFYPPLISLCFLGERCAVPFSFQHSVLIYPHAASLCDPTTLISIPTVDDFRSPTILPRIDYSTHLDFSRPQRPQNLFYCLDLAGDATDWTWLLGPTATRQVQPALVAVPARIRDLCQTLLPPLPTRPTQQR
jgi:hypothetical protein